MCVCMLCVCVCMCVCVRCVCDRRVYTCKCIDSAVSGKLCCDYTIFTINDMVCISDKRYYHKDMVTIIAHIARLILSTITFCIYFILLLVFLYRSNPNICASYFPIFPVASLLII